MDDDALADLFAGLGPIDIRRMFGGKGIYHQGLIFALAMGDGRLLLKGDEICRASYEVAGCERWTYARPGQRTAAMPYWSAPDEAMDDPDEMARWARIAFAAALRADEAKARKIRGVSRARSS